MEGEKMKNDRLNTYIKWANDYIDYFKKNVEFDPFQIITGEQDKPHKLFCECVDFLEKLEKAAEGFEQNRNKIARGVVI